MKSENIIRRIRFLIVGGLNHEEAMTAGLR